MVEDERFEEEVIRSSLDPVLDDEIRCHRKADRDLTIGVAFDDSVPTPVTARTYRSKDTFHFTSVSQANEAFEGFTHNDADERLP